MQWKCGGGFRQSQSQFARLPPKMARDRVLGHALSSHGFRFYFGNDRHSHKSHQPQSQLRLPSVIQLKVILHLSPTQDSI